MSVDIRLPNINAPDTESQVSQLKSYIYQLAEQLNWALNNMDNIHVQVDEKVGSGTVDQKAQANNTFNEIKSLIIKSSDIVEAYTDSMRKSFDGIYTAKSDFGSYAENTNNTIDSNSQGITQAFSNIQRLNDELTEEIRRINANIKYGFLYYDNSGIPVYGIEIGQRNVVNGIEMFNRYARFTADKLSFFDNSDNEVAYISNNELFITNAHVKGKLQIGGYVLKTNSGLVFKWVGRR